jgi:hypothetical protein
MAGKNYKYIMLLLFVFAISLIATNMQAFTIKKGCLTPFSTFPGEMHPLSKEKSRIVYSSQPGGEGSGNPSNIFSIRPDGTDIIQHTNSNDGLPFKFFPEYSPDNTMLAFEAHSLASNETVGRDIIVVDVTSALEYPANIKKRLDSGSGCHDMEPSFSPDNNRIVAVRECDGNPTQIQIFNIASGVSVSLGNLNLHSIASPKFSPDGTKIVFSAYHNSNEFINDIYLINSDGTGLANLTNSATEYDYDPTWSPDGQYIVYASDPEGEGFGLSELHMMYSNGTYIQALTDFNITAFHSPSFSPDGEKIVTNLYHDIWEDNHWVQYYVGMYIMNIYDNYFGPLKDPVVFEDTPFWSNKFEPPSVDVLLAYPVYIVQGSSTTLFWKTSNTYSCKIENDAGQQVGSVNVNGFIDVTPTATTTYTLKAYGLAGSVTKRSIKVIVE